MVCYVTLVYILCKITIEMLIRNVFGFFMVTFEFVSMKPNQLSIERFLFHLQQNRIIYLLISLLSS